MSKKRKHRETPVSASPPSPARGTNAIAPSATHGQPTTTYFPRSVLWQLLGIIGLGSMLGYTFNAANPVGIRFGEPMATAVVTTADGTKTGVASSSSFLPPLPH